MSTTFGQTSLASSFTYNAVGTITGATPNHGPIAGGTRVTITASTQIGSGSDITGVTVNAVAVSSIVAQTATSVTVTVAAASAGLSSVAVSSISRGVASLASAYTYNPVGTITGITPSSGPVAGSTTITISASSAIGDGSDISTVTLCGVATTVNSETTSSVIVTTPANSAGACTVSVASKAFGIASLGAAYTFNAVGTITGVVPTNGPAVGSTRITITASSPIGSGSDITAVTVKGVAALSILGQTTSTVTVTTGASTAGVGTLVVTSTAFGVASLASAYTFNAAGTITTVTPLNGAIAGGFTVTILASSPIGAGGDITAVTLAGTAVQSITAQTTSSVTVVAAAGSPTSGPVVVVSTAHGSATKSNAFTYNAPGAISFLSPSRGPLAGGNTVTIVSSTVLGAGADITVVSLAGVTAVITGQTASDVTVTAAAGAAGPGTVEVTSTSIGLSSLVNGYTYNTAGQYNASIPEVSGSTAALRASCAITLTALADFGDGSDITAVTFNGISAIVDQQTTTTVAVFPPTGAAGSYTVTISSVSIGATVGTHTMQDGGSIVSMTPADGPVSGGYPITLSGTELLDRAFVFADGDGVSFGTTVATVISSSSTRIVVTAPAAVPGQGATPVTVMSCLGSVSGVPFVYNDVGLINYLSPNNGRAVGADTVTIIAGTPIGSGSDITAVSLCGVDVASITAQTATTVTVVTGDGSANIGLCAVQVQSTRFGVSSLNNAYRYNAFGVWGSITPPQGAAGVNLRTTCSPLTIAGTNLGNGSDIVSVTFDGVASLIASQSPTEVVVYPPSASVGTSNIAVTSTHFGLTESPANSFSFLSTSIGSLSHSDGPEAGGLTITINTANTVAPLVASSVTFGGVAASILSQTSTSVTVLQPAHAAGSAAISIATCYGVVTGQAIIYNPVGTISGVSPNTGRYSGGFTVTIAASTSIGDGSDITSVTLDEAPAVILSQTASSVTVTAGDSQLVAGTVNRTVVVRSVRWGVATRDALFTYRPVPVISAVQPNLGNVAGGTQVTLTGVNLGLGSDITSVHTAGVAASILSQTTSTVTVTAAASASRLGGLNVSSESFGAAFLADCFSYAQFGDITGLIPDNGPSVGGNRVTILGGLGAGTDINLVSFNGQQQTIVSQTAGDVVVIATVGTVGPVDVQVRSVVAGTFTKSNGYTYNLPGAITSVTPRIGPSTGYRVTITGSNLGSGDITSATALSASATIIAQSPTSVTLQLGAAVGTGAIALRSVAFGLAVSPTSQAVTFNPPGSIFSVSPDNCVIAGGMFVTIAGSDLTNGTDIVSVTLAGVQAQIVLSFPSLVVVRAGSSSIARRGSVVITSVTYGVTTALATTFYYKPQLSMVSTSPQLIERGADVTVFISLDCPPAAAVSVGFQNGVHVQANVTSIDFTTTNWNVPQAFALRGLVDGQLTGPVAGDVLLTSSSSDALFNGLTGLPPVLFIDTDTAAIQITRGTFSATAELALGGLFIIEGDSRTLDVVLSSQPRAPVNVTFATNDARVQTTAYLYFTAANWNITQTLPVAAVQDFVTNVQPLTWVAMSAIPITQDPNYLQARTSVNFLVLDNDLTGSLQVVSSSVLQNTSEAGTKTAFFVVLTRHITQAATVSAAISRPTEASISPTSRTISDSDYLIPLSFVLTGLDDNIRDGDIAYDVTLSMTVSGTFSTTLIQLFNMDNDTATVHLTSSVSAVNETGSTALLSVSFTSEPIADLVVSCSSAQPHEVAVLSPQTVTLQPNQWRQPVTFTAQGVRDSLRDPNATALITCNTISSDGNYHNSSVSLALANNDIYWPNITSVRPLAFSLIGVDARVHGADFLPGVSVHVVTAQSIQLNMTYFNSSYLEFRSPLTTFVGYANVTIRNPDGGYAVYSKAYFTEDCPFEGFYGRGLDCIQCPTGGICPGGYRIQALPGYWASSEFAGFVTQCLPGRCLGYNDGSSQVCAEGYKGELCSQCSPGYYQAGLQCLQCSAPFVQALLLLAQFSFSILLLMTILFASDAALNNVQFVFTCARVLWIVSSDGGEGLPPIVAQVYGIFGLFAGDLTFVRPGCTGFTSYLQLFGVNVGFLLGLVVPITAMYVFRYKRDVRYESQGITDAKVLLEMQAVYFNKHTSDAGRGISAMLMFSYQVILLKCLQVFYCESVEGQLILTVDSNQACFTAGHAVSFVVSIFIVPVIGIVLPVYILVLAARLRDTRALKPYEHSIATNAVEEVQADVWWFPTMMAIAVDLPLAFNAVFLVRYQLAQNLVNVFVNLIAVGYVTWRKPFREWFKNAGLILTMIVSFLSQIASLLILMDSPQIASTLSYVFLAVLLIWLTGFVVIVFYHMVYLKWILQQPNVSAHEQTELVNAFDGKRRKPDGFKFMTDSSQYAIDGPPSSDMRRLSSWTSGLEVEMSSGINTPALRSTDIEQEALLKHSHSARTSEGSANSDGASPRDTMLTTINCCQQW
eukprot:TRINITY_DN2665_c0_g1_i1.p1 TRINITY_DN2665_c0_g1~~TRINITY_DN2665_c0_g1_i1.p1  ORF type:complete len:2847 (+),score=703.53 TRINITY_DN2665_c0_g1_i1:1189-8541(+)